MPNKMEPMVRIELTTYGLRNRLLRKPSEMLYSEHAYACSEPAS